MLKLFQIEKCTNGKKYIIPLKNVQGMLISILLLNISKDNNSKFPKSPNPHSLGMAWNRDGLSWI